LIRKIRTRTSQLKRITTRKTMTLPQIPIQAAAVPLPTLVQTQIQAKVAKATRATKETNQVNKRRMERTSARNQPTKS